MKRSISVSIVAIFTVVMCAFAARADDTTSELQPYAKFTAGLAVQHGLFTIWRKDNNVYLEIAPAQLDTDFIEAGQPINGLGSGDSQGNYYFMPARLIRFSRQDNKIVITWPNTNFLASPGSPEQTSIDYSFVKSVAAVAKITSIDDKTGNIVFDASSFLDDILDVAHHLRPFETKDPSYYYHLDKDRSYFAATKAFPQNILVTVNQTWTVDEPKFIDSAPDPRAIEVRVAYNIVQPPDPHQYMPRLADPRVGYFNQTLLDFRDDQKLERQIRYITRWNFKPADPTKTISVATHPMVFYLSKEIPYKYRGPIRSALLQWNTAFERIGISDAVQVQDQPNDPSWDPDDIRYSLVRWVSGTFGSGGAEAQLLYDPRTGEEFRTGITIDADLMRASYNGWQYLVNPRYRTPAGGFSFAQSEADYSAGLHRQIAFGRVALAVEGVFADGRTPPSFDADFLKSVTLHESGHDMGLQHNFIGSQAYTAKQTQDKTFTSRYGVVSSVMEYTPLNLWPKGTPQGLYFQTVLGPYDYYAIHWGYARIPGARTPEDEVPTLNRWAGQWSNPWYRFASDEDAGSIDPRVNVFDLTSDSLAWCEAQMKISRDVMSRLDQHFPWPGEAYDRERNAFGVAFDNYNACAFQAARWMGGEYMSRAHRGDPGASAPLSTVSRSDEIRAFRMVNDDFFADSAWRFSPATLNRLTYSEWTSLKSASWVYSPPRRHDVPVVELIGQTQATILSFMFNPLTLERLDDMPLKVKPGQTMSLSDLFNWTQDAAFADLRDRGLRSIPLIHRNLQQIYARQLIHVALKPDPGTPDDAQSLARAKLVSLQGDIAIALSRPLDEISAAHLQRLRATVSQALEARMVLPAGGESAPG